MRQITAFDRLRYRFDNIMAKGTIALIGGLFLITLLVIAVVSLAVFVLGIVPPQDEHALSFGQIVWMNLMHSMDAGTVAGDNGSPGFLFFMLLTTFAGIFVVSMLIGILTSGLENKLEELRKGRSFVVETDHTVILGWSNQVFSILSELAIANENKPGACVAILADKDKVEMEDEIRLKGGELKKLRIVCRSGDPLDLTGLEIVNPHASRAIIVLTPEDSQDPDSDVIKTILAITNNPERRKTPYHIVASIKQPRNLSVAKMVGGQEVEIVLADNFISRLAVQTCRQAGLSIVYQELLDFGGDEIYFKQEPSLQGRSFKEACFAYETSALMGLIKPDGQVWLNPPAETLIEAGDQLIAVSEDDDTIVLSNKRDFQISDAAISQPDTRQKVSEKTLILGWNQNVITVIRELGDYVAPGSKITVVADIPEAEAEVMALSAELEGIDCEFVLADTTDRDLLENLNIPDYDYIMTMGYSDSLDAQQADAKTLLTLLHLRDMASRNNQNFSIVSEMLDARNRELAQIAQVNDFIISDKFISLMLSQIAENKGLNQVFEDLLRAEGMEIYLKPAVDYVQLNQDLNFYTVLESASRRGELALGYKLKQLENDPGQSYGVFINPVKSKQISFTAEDKVLVLAED